MGISLNIDDKSAQMTMNSGGTGDVTLTGYVSKGEGGEYPLRPLAWLEWVDRPSDGGLRKEMAVFLERGDIVSLQVELSRLLGELDANQKNYDKETTE